MRSEDYLRHMFVEYHNNLASKLLNETSSELKIEALELARKITVEVFDSSDKAWLEYIAIDEDAEENDN